MEVKTQDQQDWIEAYKELCKLINDEVPEIMHIDLWYDQLSYEAEEYAYPEKSLFIEFNVIETKTIGLKAQDLMTQVRFIFAYDTLGDTHHKSNTQDSALGFGKIMRKLHRALQGKTGLNFSALDRIALTKEPAPESCIAYDQTYTTIIRDYSACDEIEIKQLEGVKAEVSKGVAPTPPDIELFVVDM